jgi:Tfp pilus assembly protein PilO
MSTPLERAEEAMNKAQKKLEEVEARFTAAWKRRNGEELTEQYDQEFETNALLKRLNDNLQREKESYNLLLRQQPQQGIGMGG